MSLLSSSMEGLVNDYFYYLYRGAGPNAQLVPPDTEWGSDTLCPQAWQPDPPAQAVGDSNDSPSGLRALVVDCTCLAHIPDGGLTISAWITSFYF